MQLGPSNSTSAVSAQLRSGHLYRGDFGALKLNWVFRVDLLHYFGLQSWEAFRVLVAGVAVDLDTAELLLLGPAIT
jgi:hypothetical protein